ncbi:MAG: ankyrin repeat domain-containing protein [Epsilonproteobacteria bacterium]|nr:ankyrin repeat domain-containing protein [Campylobacterota bacterium]
MNRTRQRLAVFFCTCLMSFSSSFATKSFAEQLSIILCRPYSENLEYEIARLKKAKSDQKAIIRMEYQLKERIKQENADQIKAFNNLLTQHNVNYFTQTKEHGATLAHHVLSMSPTFFTMLIKQDGFDVDCVDDFRNSLLHWAALRCKLDSVKLLLSYNANVNALNSRGLTPLDFAHKNEHDLNTYLEEERKNRRRPPVETLTQKSLSTQVIQILQAAEAKTGKEIFGAITQ